MILKSEVTGVTSDVGVPWTLLVFSFISGIDGQGISWKIAVRWMSLARTDDKATLVQVMAWCHQASSHFLSQCWPSPMLPYGVTRTMIYLHWWSRCALMFLIFAGCLALLFLIFAGFLVFPWILDIHTINIADEFSQRWVHIQPHLVESAGDLMEPPQVFCEVIHGEVDVEIWK